MSYVVKEVFRTLQGEGVLVGVPMVFVRFAGCNLWSGRDADRSRDASRHAAACPLFCDTDFIGGERLGAEALVERVRSVAGEGGPEWVCYTGGEPLLQLDAELLRAMRAAGRRAAVETNGTVALGPICDLLDWICVSPKTVEPVARAGDELKLVYRGQSEASIRAWEALSFRHYSLQPEWGPRYAEHLTGALDFLQRQPRWRLSLQTHKIVGLP